MSEMMPGAMDFNVPGAQDFDTLTYQGSMQQVLQENVGKFVIVEFLIGTTGLTTREGTLYYVGTQFLVLYDQFEDQFVVCDIFSVKFVTFLDRAGTIPYSDIDQEAAESGASADVPAAPARPVSSMRPSQAAYAHATRRNPTVRH